MKSDVILSFGIDNDSHLVIREEKVIRTVKGAKANFIKCFLESSVFGRMANSGKFIESVVVGKQIDGVLVVEHPQIPFVLYPYEWSPSMLKEAALLYLDVLTRLESEGYTLKDGHPWNIVFRGTIPVWVDLTSVVSMDEYGSFPGQEDFRNYFIRPLKLYSMELPAYARLALSQLMGPPASWLDHLGRKRSWVNAEASVKALLREVLRRVKAKMTPKRDVGGNTEGIECFRSEVQSLQVMPSKGVWSDYYSGGNELPVFSPFEPNIKVMAESTPKHKTIFEHLKNNRPKTVLDIGCNTGLYLYMAELFGAIGIGFDTEESAVDELFRSAQHGKKNICAACGDFITPIMPSEYLHKPRLRSIHDRLKADTVLCLAVVHHWVFKRLQLSFDDVVEVLSGVCGCTLIVEFVPKEDKHVMNWMSPKYSWYNIENFEAALRTHFSEIDIHESFPSPRKLLICRK